MEACGRPCMDRDATPKAGSCTPQQRCTQPVIALASIYISKASMGVTAAACCNYDSCMASDRGSKSLEGRCAHQSTWVARKRKLSPHVVLAVGSCASGGLPGRICGVKRLVRQISGRLCTADARSRSICSASEGNRAFQWAAPAAHALQNRRDALPCTCWVTGPHLRQSAPHCAPHRHTGARVRRPPTPPDYSLGNPWN